MTGQHESANGRVEQTGPALFAAHDIIAGYGAAVIVDGVSVQVNSGAIAVIVGPNGSGKSTLLKAIAGVIPLRSGRLVLREKNVTGLGTEYLARRGIGYVPQVDDAFQDLTVRENLLMGGYLLDRKRAGIRIAEILDTYPLLAGLISRKVYKLSGGERKLVAIARALMNSPEVLLLDEPTAGLSPQLSRDVLQEQVAQLSRMGTGVLLVEQRAMAALEVADWGYVLVNGKCFTSCPAHELRQRGDLGEVFLGSTGSSPAI